jgi:hypothetical protein
VPLADLPGVSRSVLHFHKLTNNQSCCVWCRRRRAM